MEKLLRGNRFRRSSSRQRQKRWKLGKLAIPPRAAAGRYRANHDLLHVVSFGPCLVDFIHAEMATKFVHFRARSLVSRVGRNKEPDVRVEPILRYALAFFQCISVEVLRLWQAL